MATVDQGKLGASDGTGDPFGRSTELRRNRSARRAGELLLDSGGEFGAAREAGGLAAAIPSPIAAAASLGAQPASCSILGTAGDDVLTGGPGDDVLDGGDGTDTAVFAGDLADYGLTFAANQVVVAAAVEGNTDGTDTLANIETLHFADGPQEAG